MKQLLLFSFLGIFSLGFGQTKMIFHKSHSGSNSNFFAGIKHSNSNFGMAPTRMVRNSKLDSVILLDDHIAVMITSEQCTEFDFGSSRPHPNSLWSAGKDTVYNHPLFNRTNSIAEIQKTLKEEYFFTNDISTVQLIGFEEHARNEHDIDAPDFDADERETIIRQAIKDRENEQDIKNRRKRATPLINWFLFGWLALILNDTY
ncbi:MAG: hypothetical protein V4638_03435 [Bacteroidota bacterium]